MSSIVANARGKPGGSGPFCWQSIHVLRHLREVCESTNKVSVAAAQSVYVALSEIATDKRSSSFLISISEVGKRAGLASRRTNSALQLIEEAGFIQVQANFLGDGQLRTANTYTLLRHDPALCKFCAALGSKPAPRLLPISVEDTKKKEERVVLSPALLEEWILKAETEFPTRDDVRRIAGKLNRHYQDHPSAMCYERLLEWVHTERNPKFKGLPQPQDVEPNGWQDFLRERCPITETSSRPVYENEKWTALEPKFREWVTKQMKSA